MLFTQSNRFVARLCLLSSKQILRSEPEHLLVATSRQRPEPLCLTPVLSPSECRFPALRKALPSRPRSYGLMRQTVHALSSLGFTSVRESLQVAASPCCVSALPDVISAVLSLDAWALHRGGVPGAFPVVFPGPLRPSPKGEWVGFPLSPPSNFPAGPISRLSPFLYDDVQASKFARHPGRSYLCVTHRAAVTFTSEQNMLSISACIGYANRPKQVTDGAGTCTPLDPLP